MKCPACLQFDLLWGKSEHTRLKTVFQCHKEPNVWFCRYSAGDRMCLLVVCIILKYFLGKYILFSLLKVSGTKHREEVYKDHL